MTQRMNSEALQSSIWERVAKRAYHAYGKVTAFKNYQGLPMPKWEDLTPTIRAAWIAASQEAVTAYANIWNANLKLSNKPNPLPDNDQWEEIK